MRTLVLSFSSLALLSLTAPHLAAQQTTVQVQVIRATTPYEREVEQLALGFVTAMRESNRLTGTLSRLRASLQAGEVPEGQRDALLSRVRTLQSQLAVMETTRNDLRRKLDSLCAPSREVTGWVGVTFHSNYTVDVGPDGVQVMKFNGYPAIESVEPGSPAEKAGARRGDVMLTLAGRDLQDAQVVFAELLKPGQRLPLRLRRGLEAKTLTLTVEPRPDDFLPTCTWEDEVLGTAFATPRTGTFVFRRDPSSETGSVVVASSGGSASAPLPTSGSDWAAGARLMPLSPGLARLSGVTQGVFVDEVALRSAAARSGLRAGDVIVAANGQRLQNPAALRALMEAANQRELQLQIRRQKATEDITLRWD